MKFDKIYEKHSTPEQKKVLDAFPHLDWLNNGAWVDNRPTNWFFYIVGNQDDIFKPSQWEDEEYVIVYPNGKIVHQHPDFQKEMNISDIKKIIAYINFK